jgi:PAS domain S-box-containing protein
LIESDLAPFKLLVEGLVDQGLFLVAKSGRILSWNAGAARITGYAADEVLGQLLDVLWPAENGLAQPFDADAITRKGEWTARRPIKRKDGELADVSIRIHALDPNSLHSAFGVLLQAIESTTPDTVRSPSTIDLLQAAIDGSPDAIFIKGLDGRYLLVNQTAIEFAGKSRDQVLGRCDADFFDADTVAQLLARDEQIIKTGIASTQEEVLIKNGATHICLVTKSPYRNLEGRIAGVLGIARDITELKRAETELLQSERRFRLLLENARVVIWEADPASFDFTYVSDYCEELLGYPAEQWLDHEFWTAHIHPDDAERAMASCLESIKHARDNRFEYRMVRADGTHLWVDDSVKVVAEDGRVTALYGSLVDITQRKLNEQAIRDSEVRYRAFVDHATDAMFLHVPHGRIVDLNQQA